MCEVDLFVVSKIVALNYSDTVGTQPTAGDDGPFPVILVAQSMRAEFPRWRFKSMQWSAEIRSRWSPIASMRFRFT